MSAVMTHFTFVLLATLAITACSGSGGVSVSTAQAAPAPITAANAEVIRDAVRKAGAPAPATDIQSSPIAGFQEAVVRGQMVYVSNDGKLLLHGALIDVETQDNLSDRSLAKRNVKQLAEVPADHRIVFAAANPKHRITVFTDVDCGYCRKLHSEIAELNKRGITVEYLLYPRGGVDSPAYGTSVNVWCAADRKQALTDAKAGRPLPARTCENPVARDYAAGGNLGVRGTPGIFAANGMQIGGYLPPDALLARLEREAARKAQ